MLKLSKGFLEVEARTRDPKEIVASGQMPKSDYFVVRGNKKYPKGTEVVLSGTSILHILKEGNYVLREEDIIGYYGK